MLLALRLVSSSLSDPLEAATDHLIAGVEAIVKHADLIQNYALQWKVGIQRPSEVVRKIGISLINVVIYGVAG